MFCKTQIAGLICQIRIVLFPILRRRRNLQVYVNGILLASSAYVYSLISLDITLNAPSAANDTVLVHDVIGGGRAMAFAPNTPILASDLNDELAQRADDDTELRRDLMRAIMAPPGKLPFDMPWDQDATGKLLMGVAPNLFGLVSPTSALTFTGSADVVDTVALLRAVNDVSTTYVVVKAHTTPGDALGGGFVTDGSTGHLAGEDDNDINIVGADGRLWVRKSYVKIVYDTIADFLASTEVSRSVGSTWVAGEQRLTEAASGATDHEYVNAAGVKFYRVLPSYVEIVNDPSPLNYFGTNTRASTVLQHRDTADGASNELIPGSVFQYKFSGDGVVNSGTETSSTVWQGLYTFTEKLGDGSGHCFTALGELGAFGVGGYNELGLFQGEATNKGSTLGTLSGVEMLMKDSPDAGTNKYSTKMQPIVSRIAKYHTTTRRSDSFFASSEGTQAPNSILAGDTGGLASWQRGIDFQGLTFTSGQASLFPNNASQAWLDAGGSAVPIVTVSASNETLIAAGSASSSVKITTKNFARVNLQADTNANDAVLIFVGGALKRIGEGATDSAGAGFKNLIVAN